MKTKAYMVPAVVIIAIVIGVAAYAHGPGGGSRGGNGMGGGGYGMMGGHSMMGGYDRLGRYASDVWDKYKWSSRDVDQGISDHNIEIESLRKQVQEKRLELASMYRSDDVDRALMEKKIKELNNLERLLDEKLSSYETGR